MTTAGIALLREMDPLVVLVIVGMLLEIRAEVASTLGISLINPVKLTPEAVEPDLGTLLIRGIVVLPDGREPT